MMDVISKRRVWFAFSGALIGVSLLAMALWQFKFGIDFTGGALVELRFTASPPASSEVVNALSEFGASSVQTTADATLIVRLPPQTQDSHQRLLIKTEKTFGAVTEERFESIGPTIGKELRDKALIALLIVFVSVIVYIAYTFRRVSKPISSWVYGVITVVAAFHDVIVPLGLFSILGTFGGIEIGSAFVAAILTIMGYSINDTIVVLDRVRENLSRSSGPFEAIVEKSVHQSFARSLNTTMTTLLALVAVFFFGGESVKYFALALIVGIAVGAYSSLFIAAPLLVVWHRRQLRQR